MLTVLKGNRTFLVTKCFVIIITTVHLVSAGFRAGTEQNRAMSIAFLSYAKLLI